MSTETSQTTTSSTKFPIKGSLLLGALLLLTIIVQWIFGLYQAPLAGQVTAQTLNGGTQEYANQQAFASLDGMFYFLKWVFGLGLVLIWIPTIVRSIRNPGASSYVSMALVAVLLGLTSCGEYKTLDVKEIKPNETVWVVPLTGDSQGDQEKFDSIGFLESKKVQSKRIMIDKVQRNTGRMPWDYEWIPAVRVITVDRLLVTREWTKEDSHETNDKEEGILVVTQDSIRLVVGLTITASIDEADASTYLYYHGDRPLSEVIDQNIRSYAVAELTNEYSKLTLTDAQLKGPAIFGALFEKAKAEFKSKGITIHFLGNAEGLRYENETIQEAINKVFLAEQDQKTAVMEQTAQNTRNATMVLTAQATADAAKKLFEAEEAARFQNDLEVRLKAADAGLEMAKKWSGNLPASILPSDSPLLLNLGAGAGAMPPKQ